MMTADDYINTVLDMLPHTTPILLVVICPLAWLLSQLAPREFAPVVMLLTVFVVRQLPAFFQVYWIDVFFALFTDRSQRAFELLSKTRVVRA